jgi:hypothetical protein
MTPQTIYITKTKAMVEKKGEPTPPPLRLSGTLNEIRIRREKPKRNSPNPNPSPNQNQDMTKKMVTT